MDIYCLGPKGTYCEKAAKNVLNILGEKNNIILVSTISKVVEKVNNDSCAAAVLPFENSIEGIVRQTIDNIYLTDIKILAEIDVKIEHCLVSKDTDLSKITKIYSHPQALAQCSDFITQNFNEKIELIVSNSTAEAANIALNSAENVSAIASYDIAKELNLNILSKNIGNIKENKTRFVFISKSNIDFGKNIKTSVAFNTKNEPGALLKILQIFNDYNINLTFLESRPSKTIFGEYNFFADIDKPYEDIIEATGKIKEKCNFYKLLGSYPVIEIK